MTWKDEPFASVKKADFVVVRKGGEWFIVKDEQAVREGRGAPWADKAILPGNLALFVLGLDGVSEELRLALDAAYRTGGGEAVVALLAGELAAQAGTP